MSGSDGFLGRWSRRKAEARKPVPDPGEPEARTGGGDEEGSTGAQAASNLVPAERDGAAEPELPEIETLGPDSDFTVFMQRGVPDALRKRALRRLWRLDPAFSNLDGLVEYGEDYNASARNPEVVRTAWRIGRGMSGPETDTLDEIDDSVQEARDLTPDIDGSDDGSPGEDWGKDSS